MFGLEKHSDMFGKPNTGVHKHRFMNLAIVDVVATILVGWLVSYIYKLNPVYVISLFFIVGIILHAVFNVRTTVDKILFPNYTG